MFAIKQIERLRRNRAAIKHQVAEAARSVLPIVLTVFLLCMTVSPVPTDLMLSFLIGTLLLIAGMGLFSLGAESAMSPIGSKIGTALTKTKNLPLILIISFVLGFSVTVAEPDLQVLAETAPHINSTVLLITVGVGVGLSLSLCMLRILTGFRLRWLLLGAYLLLFLLAAFTDRDFLGISFDSGGVTTGPMTVPLILALGLGISSVRSDSKAEADSFGLVALCSIGPILAVLILGFFSPSQSAVTDVTVHQFSDTAQVSQAYWTALPDYLLETAVALLPIVALFLLFQLFALRLSVRGLAKISIGLLYTYIGLVLFLTGAHVGFSALGTVLGASLATSWLKSLMIPLAMVLGWFIISAEPAVVVLQKQIEQVSAGAISARIIKFSLSAAIAIAMGLAMVRVFTGISLMWFLVPGYALALLLSFFVPDIYTAIAFDAGGVASGPMTATLMMQFVIGSCTAMGGSILQDAFGMVALVAMMPLLSVQLVGFIFGRQKKEQPVVAQYGEFDIVELWEVQAS